MCKFTWNPKTRCLVNVGSYYVPWIGCSQLHTDVVSNASVSQGEGKPLSCFGASFNLFCGTAIPPFYKAPGLRCLLAWEAVCCHDWTWCFFWRTGLCRVMLMSLTAQVVALAGMDAWWMNEWMKCQRNKLILRYWCSLDGWVDEEMLSFRYRCLLSEWVKC